MNVRIGYFAIALLVCGVVYGEDDSQLDVRYSEVSGRWFGSAGAGVLRFSVLGYDKSVVQIEWLKSESNDSYKLSKFCSWSSPVLTKDIRNVNQGGLRQNAVLSSVEVNADSAFYKIELVSNSSSENLVLKCARAIKSVDSCLCSFTSS